MNNFTVLLFFVPILSALLLVINLIISNSNPDESKVSPYESGMPVIIGQTRGTFHIHFFIVALLFLVFDLEVILLLPLAVSLFQVSVYGLSIAIIFFLVLTVGFVLEIGSGSINLKTTTS